MDDGLSLQHNQMIIIEATDAMFGAQARYLIIINHIVRQASHTSKEHLCLGILELISGSVGSSSLLQYHIICMTVLHCKTAGQNEFKVVGCTWVLGEGFILERQGGGGMLWEEPQCITYICN